MAPSPAPSPTPPPPETDSIIDGLGASIAEENEGAVALPSFGNAEQNDVLGEPPEPPKEEKKPWDKPLTIPEIRKSSTNWSLASDSGLLLYLQEFSQRMIAKTSHLEKEVDGLVNTAKSTNTRVHNTFNDFLMLANTQFIENRVYDDSEDVEPPDKEDKTSKKEPQSKSREQREAEVIPRVIKALTLGVNVLDTAFEQLDANAGNSDSEDEDATYKSVDPILEPKDLYAHRALPYIIGTPAFMQDDDVGLADLYSDEEGGQSSSDDEGESETSESEYSDTDTESGDESAPKKGSRTTSTAKSGVSGDEYESDGDLFASDKAESDSEGSQSGTSKPKASPFTDELAAKVAAPPPSTGAQSEETKARSVSEVSHTSSKHGKKDAKRKKKSKKQRSDSQLEKTDEDNLFGSPEGEDEDSPFGGKGLFSNTGGGLFDDEGAGLFDETPTKKKDHIYEDVNAGADQPKRQKAPSSSGLFDDEENDLFGSTPPASKQEPIKSSKPPAPSDSGLFGDDDDLFGEPETKAANKAEKKQSVDLFGEDDDDLFGNESSAPKESKKKLPAGAVPMFGGANPLAGRRPPSISSDDDDFEEPPKMESQPKPQTKDTTTTPKTKPADDLFNNDDEDDLFSTPKEESNTKPKSRATAESLFDDIDGGGTEDDLFAATAKEPTKKKPVGGVALFGGADLFGGSPPKDKEEEKENESVKSRTGAKNRSTANTLSIFNDQLDGDGEDDLFADKPEEENDKSNMRSRSKSKSLFADEDVLFGLNEDDPSVDLFGSSSPTQSSKPDSPPSKGPKPAASASSGLFSDEDEDDLFGGSDLNKPKQVMVESTDISKPAETKKTKVAAGAGLFGDDDDDDLFGEGGPTPEKLPAKEPTKHKKHLAGAVSMFGGIDPASLIKEGPSPEQTGPSQHVVHGDIPPKSPLHDPSPPITSPKPPKKPETKKPAPVKTAQKPSSPPAAAAKISALQHHHYRKPTPVRKRYPDGSIERYRPDKPLPDIPQSSISRRNASRSLPVESMHSPPVPARRPIDSPEVADLDQYLSPPIWHYMERNLGGDSIYQSIDDVLSNDAYIEPIYISDREREFLSDQEILSDQGRWTQQKRHNRSRERKPVPLRRNLSPDLATPMHPKPPLRLNNSSDTDMWERPPPPLPRIRNHINSPRIGRSPNKSNSRCVVRKKRAYKHHTPLKMSYSGDSDSSTSSESYQTNEFFDLSRSGSPYAHKKITRCMTPPNTLPLKPIVENSPSRLSPLVKAVSAFSFSPEVTRKAKPQISSPFRPRRGVFDETYFSDGAKPKSPNQTAPRQCFTPPPRPPKPSSPSAQYRKPIQKNKRGPASPTTELVTNTDLVRKSATHPRPPKNQLDVPKPNTIGVYRCEREPPEGQSFRRLVDGNISSKDLPTLPRFLNPQAERGLKLTNSSASSSGYISSDCSFLKKNGNQSTTDKLPVTITSKGSADSSRCSDIMESSHAELPVTITSKGSADSSRCSDIMESSHAELPVTITSKRSADSSRCSDIMESSHAELPVTITSKGSADSLRCSDIMESSHADLPVTITSKGSADSSRCSDIMESSHAELPVTITSKGSADSSRCSDIMESSHAELPVTITSNGLADSSRCSDIMESSHAELPVTITSKGSADSSLCSDIMESSHAELPVTITSTESADSSRCSDIMKSSHAELPVTITSKGSADSSRCSDIMESSHAKLPAAINSKGSAESSLCSDIMKSSQAKRRGQRKPCRETFLLKKSLFESLSNGIGESLASTDRKNKLNEELPRHGNVKETDQAYPVVNGLSPRNSSRNTSRHTPQHSPRHSPRHSPQPSPISSPRPSRAHDPPQVAPKPMARKCIVVGDHQQRKRQSVAPTLSLGTDEANLAIDPTALRPGAAPPRREEPILKVGFDVPVAVKPLTSLQKSRPRHTVKRRLPSRKITASNQSGDDYIDGAIGGASLLSRSPPSSLGNSRSPPPLCTTTTSPPQVHSQFSRSPPAWKPVKAPTLTKSSDLFGDDDDDLFGDPPELVKAAPQIEQDLPPEDPLGGEQARKDPLLEGEQAGVTSPPLPVDEDIFSDLSPKQEEDKESRPLADPSLKESDDLFGESKAVVPSLDVDTDLFAPVLSPQEKGILDDDDLFGELTGAKPKKKPAKVVEQDDDDLFAEQPKKPSKGKKVKPDSDLFADTTDIFAEIPASKPKGKKSKKKDADIFKSTVEDDIFSSSSSSTPSKTKKKAKKKTKPAADSIFDSSAPSIFDDPLNATKTD